MEKLLKGNSAVRTAETFVAGAAAMKLLEVGCIPLIVGVVAFVATTIWIVKSIKSGKGNLTRKAKMLMVALATVSTISLIYGVYHKLNCHNFEVMAEEATNEVVTENTEPEEPVEEQEPTEETTEEVEAPNAGKIVASRGYCPSEDRIELTYGNVGGNNSGAANSTSAKTTVVDPAKDTLHITSEDKNSQDDDLAKDKNQKTEMSDGIISSADEIRPKEDVKDLEDNDKATMDKDNAIETKSEESTSEEKSEEPKEEEVKPAEASDSELDDMLKQTEIIDTNPEIGIVEVKADVFPKDTEIEEPAEEVKSEEKAVTVEAIDGYVANINSTVQFKISGDNIKIDGLDGMEFSFDNGVLNISTGSEATILTVEVSNSVSSVSFDIVINGVVK